MLAQNSKIFLFPSTVSGLERETILDVLELPTATSAVLTTEYLEGRKARAIPGSWWDPDERAWLFEPAADEGALTLALRLFPDLRLRLDPELVASAEAPPENPRPFDAATPWAQGYSTEALLPNTPAALRALLYPYQATDLGYCRARMAADKGAYIGWDRGLGKTLGALVLMYELGVERAVIVCPNSSKGPVWAPEFEKWAPGRWEVASLGGSKQQRERTLAKWALDGGVLLAHYEVLRLVDWGKQPPADLVIVDEAHRLANCSASHKSPQFCKALKKIRTTYRLALSGSIIVNSPEDFFGANHWLFPRVYKSKWKDWNDKHLHYIEGSFGRVLIGVRKKQIEPMRRELGQFMVVRRKQDELPGLPDRIEQTLRVQLSDTQRRIYDDLAESFIAELTDGSTLAVGSVITQLTKLRQIATGLDLLGDDFTDSSKLDLAESLITDNLPRKTVVFCWHRATARALAERLAKRGIEAGVVTGDVKMNVRTMLVDRFQTSSELPVLVATIKTLGESVTLHAASDLIFIESSWTPTDMEQAADRVYRIGQKHRVTITSIVAENTVDESRILPAVMSKAAMKQLVLGGSHG